MNGGLCDFAFNFKDLANELSKFLEYNKTFNKLMTIVDIDGLSKIGEEDNHLNLFLKIDFLDEKNKIIFNEDAVCGMIKTGTIFKLCSDYIEQSIIFLKILLDEKYASNKILSKKLNTKITKN